MDTLDVSIAKSYVKKSMQGAGAVKGQKGDPGENGEDGFSPTITENTSNRDNCYKLDITNKDGTFTTPNLMGVIGMEYTNKAVGTPVGEIISFMGATAPTNYLICDGTTYQISDYPILAQHFVDHFSSANYFGGDGETTFSVPDLRGEFLRGAGSGARDTGSGAAVGAHQNPTSIPYIMPSGSSNNLLYATKTIWNNGDKNTMATISLAHVKPDSVTTETSYKSFYVRPTNTSVLYCIKYQPSYFVKVEDVNYSYEERKIGTWLDGKPLYEKTIDFGSLPNNVQASVPHGILDADTIWIAGGYVSTLQYGNYGILGNPSPQSLSGQWTFWVTRSGIFCTTGTDRTGSKAIITLRYTKTID